MYLYISSVCFVYFWTCIFLDLSYSTFTFMNFILKISSLCLSLFFPPQSSQRHIWLNSFYQRSVSLLVIIVSLFFVPTITYIFIFVFIFLSNLLVLCLAHSLSFFSLLPYDHLMLETSLYYFGCISQVWLFGVFYHLVSNIY